MAFLDEAQVELSLIATFKGLSYNYAFGPDIACDGPATERSSYGDAILNNRLRSALVRLNPGVPPDAIDDAIRKITRAESPSLIENNRRFHRLLIDGVPVEYSVGDGQIKHDAVRLIDFDEPDSNDWLVVNQFTMIENGHNRRPDVVVFVNGLPLALIELKNPADENATIHRAFRQVQTYKRNIPALFACNEVLVVSDGLEARCGTLTSEWDRFMPWRTIDGGAVAPAGLPQLDVLVTGMFEKKRFLDLMRSFIVFEDDSKIIAKKLAAYHQFHAVNKAVDCTVRASSPEGDRRIGVVWHTQGSGKSLSMVFYAGKIIQHPAMANPTLLVITDRNDLDQQLFGTFGFCKELIRQTPLQAGSRAELRELLSVASGGVIFTTMQKFLPDAKGDAYPMLSGRRNIVVIADEAHRSQYDFIDGLARNLHDALPNASFIGFTGTPIEASDRSTPAVFGDYIDVYDILRAVEDGATVRIYYEGRLAKIELDQSERPTIDPEFDEVTESEEEESRRKLKSRWSRLEAMVGAEKRLSLVAADLVEHFENRSAVMEGKALVVCMSRRICVDLYNEIIKLRPGWHDPDDEKGALKIVMTGSASDPEGWQAHIRNKAGREKMAKRFKNAADPLKLVIVRDMWLTGFDVPCLHTMYVDKPMRGHGLMQAIARVNRVFRDKPGGLVVDYLGLADELKRALANYTQSGGQGKATHDQAEAVAILLEKYEVIRAMFYGFDYLGILRGAVSGRMAGLAAALEHILALEDGKKRFVEAVTLLSKAFALAVPNDQALAIRDEVGFFQAVRAALTKSGGGISGQTEEDLDAAIRQIVSRAVISDEVVDIFSAAGLQKPEISILSDEFLAEVKALPQRNLAVELLRRLLSDAVKVRSRKNVVQARSFAEMLEESIRRYQNRSIETAQVIVELIELAKTMREALRRGEEMGLSDEEVAFYDALEVNDSAVKVLGDTTLRTIARELVEAVRRNVTIDWTVRESARAGIRVLVKRILRKYGYPPDKQERATQTVLEQAELLAWEQAAA